MEQFTGTPNPSSIILLNLGLLRSSASALCITYLLKNIEKKTHNERNGSNYGEVNHTTDEILPPTHIL